MKPPMLPFALFASCFSLASLSQAQTPPATNQQLFLTIYNNNLALVEDKRNLVLPQGRSTLEFKDVSASIRPETVSLLAPGVNIIEQNFDFDLLTPGKLMEKSVGQQVQLVRTNPGNGQQITEVATVLSVNEGVVLNVNGRIEVLRADAIPTRVLFNKIPDNLRAHPTLSINVDADKAGTKATALSYLTTGLSWKADYVALFDEKSGKLNLQGWITLTNSSGTSFNNVNAQLVAGDINVTNSMTDYDAHEKRRIKARSTTGTDYGRKPALADYYVYPLGEKTTIANKQTKQIGFLEATGINAKKTYCYEARGFRGLEKPEHVDVAIDFNNSKPGLGTPLPTGIIRVYMQDQNAKPTFIGESAIDHTPQGMDISVRTGEAFDVTVQANLVKEERIDKAHRRIAMEYIFHNALNQAVTVSFEQIAYNNIKKVVSESLKGKQPDAYSLKWDVPVSANNETKLAFVIEDEY